MIIQYVWVYIVDVNVTRISNADRISKKPIPGVIKEIRNDIPQKAIPLWMWCKYDPQKLMGLSNSLTFILGGFEE